MANFDGGSLGGAALGAGFGPIGALAGFQLGGGDIFGDQKQPGFNVDYSGMAQYPGAVTPLENGPNGLQLAQGARIPGSQGYENNANNLVNWSQMQAQNQAANGAGTQAADANAQLASHGGLDSGARQQMAVNGMKNSMDAQQNAAAQAQGSKLGVAANAAQMQQQANMANNQNLLNAEKMQNDYNLGKMQSQNQAWAAGQQAQATAAAAPQPKTGLQKIPLIGDLF